jgi:glutamyl-tRNA synthetase
VTEVVGRLAPSPTGHLHLGHARSFLLAWWHARAREGRIVLRIEDLDVDRVKPGMIDETFRDLEWLGLDWDGKALVQSHDLAEIDAAAQSLVARGRAYACTCSRKEIQAAQSAPHAGEAVTRYPGTCRGRYASLEEAERASGRPAALRFVVEPGVVRVEDGMLGVHAFDVAHDVGDFPVLRRAGFPAYQLAVVVDDARQGVTEIVRGADLLDSTARQALLQEALDLPKPRTWHVPLVTDESGRRLAKRSDDVSLARLRASGLDARKLVSWIARRSGIDAREPATAHDLAPHFDMTRVPRDPLAIGARELAELGLASP